MSKTYNKTSVFANSEPVIIRKVMKWFEKELNLKHNDWHWYIKININKPMNEAYRTQVENKVVNYWLNQSDICFESRYPTTVSYIKNTKHKLLKKDDFGTLIIEYKSNIIAQIVKNFVKTITHRRILNCNFDEILYYMRGIIAAESCIEIHIPSMKYRVHLSASNPKEKEIFHISLKKLGVESKIYKYDKLIISKKRNNFKLLELDLMSLNPTKSKKFLEMINCYSVETRNNFLIKESKSP